MVSTLCCCTQVQCGHAVVTLPTEHDATIAAERLHGQPWILKRMVYHPGAPHPIVASSDFAVLDEADDYLPIISPHRERSSKFAMEELIALKELTLTKLEKMAMEQHTTVEELKQRNKLVIEWKLAEAAETAHSRKAKGCCLHH